MNAVRAMPWVLALSLAATAALAQEEAKDATKADTQVVTTVRNVPAKRFDGAQWREATGKARELVDGGQVDAAADALLPAMQWCAQATGGTDRVIAVASDAEVEEFRATLPTATPVRAVDTACSDALIVDAFVHVGRGDAEGALRSLDAAVALSPFDVQARSERAFVVGRLGDPTRALALYHEAQALAKARNTPAWMQAVLLRGIGYQQTELGDLDAARKSYEDSLVIDPGNEIAINELAYLADLQKQGGATKP